MTRTFTTRLLDIHGRVPSEDGMGYSTSHTQGGAGFSMTRFSYKPISADVGVHKVEYTPSPYEIGGIYSTRYSVWIGQTEGSENGPCPFPVPAGATASAWCPDAEVDWFADFGEDGEAAEAFAAGRPSS